jgi:hypothetical protein
MTFPQKAIGIFSSPGRVFEELPSNATRSDWLLPLFIYSVVTAITMQLVMAKDSIASHFRTLAENEILPPLEQFVQQGTISQDQSQWIFQFAIPGTASFFVAQLIGTFVGTLILILAIGLILWQLGKSVMREDGQYSVVVAILGLTLLVATCERIVTAFLMVLTDSIFATPSAGLLLLQSPMTPDFALLSRINGFTVWEIWLVALGLAWLFDREISKVFVLLGSLWLLWTLLTVVPLFV